jgi:hypothetical protein
MLLGEPSPWVIRHFSGKFNDFNHWKCYKISEKCLRTKQLRKLLPKLLQLTLSLKEKERRKHIRSFNAKEHNSLARSGASAC